MNGGVVNMPINTRVAWTGSFDAASVWASRDDFCVLRWHRKKNYQKLQPRNLFSNSASRIILAKRKFKFRKLILWQKIVFFGIHYYIERSSRWDSLTSLVDVSVICIYVCIKYENSTDKSLEYILYLEPSTCLCIILSSVDVNSTV